MQRRRPGKLQALAGLFEIPPDIVLDLPRLTMLGNQQLLVENHKGIIEYTPVLVRIKLNLGELKVIGTNMVLSNLQSEQILLDGSISEIKFDG